VLIADGNPSLAVVLAELMADEPGFELAGCVASRREALELAGSACVDVVLVDPRLADTGSGCLLAELRALCPSAVLLVWSCEGDGSGEHVDGRLDRGMTFRELVSAARGALRVRRTAAAPLTPADR
jgi:DNA-binding NarL/FixJ family response regulator